MKIYYAPQPDGKHVYDVIELSADIVLEVTDEVVSRLNSLSHIGVDGSFVQRSGMLRLRVEEVLGDRHLVPLHDWVSALFGDGTEVTLEFCNPDDPATVGEMWTYDGVHAPTIEVRDVDCVWY